MADGKEKIYEMLDLAKADIRKMRGATSSLEARRIWSDFLEHSNRALNRMEGYAGKNNKSAAYKKLIDSIWGDPVASYMRAARNAHEHGMDEIDILAPKTGTVKFANGITIGGVRIEKLGPDGFPTYTYLGPPTEIESAIPYKEIPLPPTVELILIRGKKGTVLRPPVPKDLAFDGETTISAVARLYLDWVESRVVTF